MAFDHRVRLRIAAALVEPSSLERTRPGSPANTLTMPQVEASKPGGRGTATVRHVGKLGGRQAPVVAIALQRAGLDERQRRRHGVEHDVDPSGDQVRVGLAAAAVGGMFQPDAGELGGRTGARRTTPPVPAEVTPGLRLA